MYFDIGRGGKPVTEYDIQEYNKSWFAPILNWIFPEETRYTPYYDFCGMLIRFAAPCLTLFFIPTFNSGFILCGLWVAMVYGLGWVMRDKAMLKKIGPTEFGEYASGAFVGWMTVICGMI